MRNISHRSVAHNAARGRALPLALACVLLAAGCSRDDTGRAGQAATPAPGAPCPVAVDVSGWQAFTALADRVVAGDLPDAPERTALGEQPAFTLWRESLDPDVPAPLRVGNWFEDAFWDELGSTGRRKVSADRLAISASYRWSWERRARIDSLAARFAAGGACGILARSEGFIDPARMPRPLQVYVLPGKPEIRYREGRVFLDTGVLAAGQEQQLVGQIAGLLYRNVQAEDGPNPLEAAGDLAVAHTFRVLRNEAVATWLEDLAHTSFDPEHPRLSVVRPVPEIFFEVAIRKLATLDEALPRLFADPAEMEARGPDFARTIAAGGFNQIGYCMATVIVERLGRERFATAARSVPGFVAAFQEAALLNGSDRPLPGAVGREPWEAMAPLSPAAWDQLRPLLERVFGTAP